MPETENRSPKLMDFHLVKFVEDGWDPEFLKKTGKIETVCLYDAGEVTHLCEFTPSYYLIPLYYVTEKQIDDATDAELAGVLAEPFYVHCHQVGFGYHIGNPLKAEDRGKTWDELNMDYEGALEGVIEHETCNHRF